MSDEQARLTAISVFAGEVVLGTSNRTERSIVEERLSGDPVYQAEVKAWERRLAPLGAVVAPARPSADLWSRIVADTLALAPDPAEAQPSESAAAPVIQIDSETAQAARNRILERRIARWRLATLGALAIAASVVGVAIIRPGLIPTIAPPGDRYIGVVNAAGEMPPLIVSVDVARGELSVRPLALPREAGKDLELWAIPDGAPPVSLGLVGAGGPRPIPVKVQQAITPKGLTIAVSVEPSGGSPTGQPTGSVILTGKLIRATDAP
jgi:anti-sigma-K factor RskA